MKKKMLSLLAILMPVLIVISLSMIPLGSIGATSSNTVAAALPTPPPPAPFFPPAPTTGFKGMVDIKVANNWLTNAKPDLKTPSADTATIIDVRSPWEYKGDEACPLYLLFGMPINFADFGHPYWTSTSGTHESYSNPYWIGFYYSKPDMSDAAPVLNPDWDAYLQALVSSGQITKHEKLIFMCQTGYRASYAAQRATTLGFKNCWVLSGGMLAWMGDYPAANGAADPQVDVTVNPADLLGNTSEHWYTKTGPAYYKGKNPVTLSRHVQANVWNIPADPNNAALLATIDGVGTSAPYAYNPDLLRTMGWGYRPIWDGTSTYPMVLPPWDSSWP